jgi:flagellar hook-associated protein 2
MSAVAASGPAISFNGLASGLDSASIISALMGVERSPQNILKAQIVTGANRIRALQTVNTQTAALTTLANTLISSTAMQTFAGTSSSPTVTVDATASTSSASVSFTVEKLAQNQVSVSGAMSSWPSTSTFSIVTSAGTTEINPADTNLDTVVKAINSSTAGVTASKVDIGGGQYRLMFTDPATGSAAKFDIVAGNASQASSGTAPTLLAGSTQTAQDAQITLFPGSTVAQIITSATNKFSGILPGANISVSALSVAAVTATVAQDPKAASDKLGVLVSSLNAVMSTVQSGIVANLATAPGGTTVSGLFAGNATVSALQKALSTSVTSADPSRSPNDIGINLGRDGTLTLDPAKFATALAANPSDVAAYVGKIATSVAAVGASYSDKFNGLITTNIAGYTSEKVHNQSRVDQMEVRLVQREVLMKAQYSRLEVAIGSMNSLRASLTAAIGGLPTWSPAGK